MAVATLRWSDAEFQPGVRARLSWDVVGAADAMQAIAASGVMREDSTHPLDATLRAVDPPLVVRDGFALWRVTTEFLAAATAPGEASPLDAPWVIDWGIGSSSEDANRDGFGNAVVNGARDPFVPGLRSDRTTYFLSVERTEKGFDPVLAEYYGNTTNSNVITLGGRYKLPPGTVRCLRIAPASRFELGAPSLPIRYDFEFRGEGHVQRVLNVGRRGWYRPSGAAANSMPVLGLLEHKILEPVSEDVPLRRDGRPVDPSLKINGQTPVPCPYPLPSTVRDEPVPNGNGWCWLLYEMYPRRNYAPLKL